MSVAESLAQAVNVGAWLLAAYTRRRGPNWPSFPEAMESYTYGRLILQEALHPASPRLVKRPEVVRPDPPPDGVSSRVAKPDNVTVTKRDHPRGSPTPQAIDFKSRAAGERPDAEDS